MHFNENNFMKLREYSGNGQITFHSTTDITMTVKFVVDFNSNGRIRVLTTVSLFSNGIAEIFNSQKQKEKLLHATLSGTVDGSGKVEIDDMILDKTNLKFDKKLQIADANFEFMIIKPVVIRYIEAVPSSPMTANIGLTNFLFGGLERTSTEGGGWKIDKFGAKLDQHRVVFKQLSDYEVKIKQLAETREAVVSSEMIIESASEKEDGFADDVAILLSLASRTHISPIYEDYFQEDKLLRSILNPFQTPKFNKADPLIDMNQLGNADLKNYLETSFPLYVSNKERLGLRTAINYYLSSGTAYYLEMKYLFMCISIECLASNYAKLSKDEGREIKSNQDIEKRRERLHSILKTHSCESPELVTALTDFLYIKIGLKDILRAALTHYSIPFTEQDLEFAKTRREIVHTGRFPDETTSLDEYHSLIYFIDRIILSLLGNRGGYFLDIRNQYERIQLV